MQLQLGDCFELMKHLPDASVDFVCTDMPYGVTKAHWDCKIDLGRLWGELKRVAKPNAAFALFGSGKFAYKLVFSNFKDFRYRYTWFKQSCAPTGFLNAKRRPLVASEDVLVFGSVGTYNPQRRYPTGGSKPWRDNRDSRQNLQGGQCLKSNGQFYGIAPRTASASLDGKRYPTDVLLFESKFNGDRINPTQKPVDLLEFLIRTYTNEGELVLDPFMGSGSCGVACVHTGRCFIGMEKDPTFFDGAKAWIASEQKNLMQDQ
ncbi:MAG TPA: site-specific DNA-methyltransferase [Candidatus Anaerobiospirillum pullistercoris]|uniref:Methyltransferase n=1 Tax=Candidatus Anaerobiospirillum pullistercoris TaxID=2838452 RepID=A0A9D1WAY6_9GAMM|nr:site-specific DNA-methyltransferase [Candidatus Anaerobiospirillum pullistercoris]